MKSKFINDLDQKFINAKTRNRAAIMPFLTMGYPNQQLSLPLLETLSENGADIIEVGIPFSDPIADGPVIQASSKVALDNGITPEQVFDVLAVYAERNHSATLVIMTYYNILLQQGLEAFVLKCNNVGVSGVIVPDLPLEENATLKRLLDDNQIHLIHFVPPNISDQRIEQIANQATGFIYLISVTGVTGKRKQVPTNLDSLYSKLREHTQTPIALGFGISNAEQVMQAAKSADGVIIGSALIEKLKEPQSALDNAAVFIREVSNYA